MMIYSEESLRDELHSRGWRSTPQREAILRYFLDLPEGQHLNAEEIQARLQQEGHTISLATVYRTVKMLSEMGILRELELKEGHKYYELNQLGSQHHHHLVCIKTNEVIEFKDNKILAIVQKVAEKYGYRVLDCQLTVIGISPEGQRSIL